MSETEEEVEDSTEKKRNKREIDILLQSELDGSAICNLNELLAAFLHANQVGKNHQKPAKHNLISYNLLHS